MPKVSGRGHHNYKDGRASEPLGRIWTGMIYRCTKPYMRGYENYGGRGITVCERWMTYLNFKEDMEESYWKHRAENGMTAERVNTTLDRIDNDKGYSPDNCRWATYLEQRHNQREHNLTRTKPAYKPFIRVTKRTPIDFNLQLLEEADKRWKELNFNGRSEYLMQLIRDDLAKGAVKQ